MPDALDSLPPVTTRPLAVAVLAMGGQGGGVLIDWVVSLAESQGFFAQATSVPGVAQRTGATLYYVELLAPPPGGFAGRSPVLALMPAPGDVDLLVGAELMEAGRGLLRGLASPDRTVLVASTHRALAVSEKITPGDGAGDPLAVLDAARSAAKRCVAFDMASLADQAGSVISAVLFGAIAGGGALPFPRAAFEATIREAGIGVEASLRAFALGFSGAAHPVEPSASVRPTKIFAEFDPHGRPDLLALAARLAGLPEKARPMAAVGLRRVVEFQDAAYGSEYLDHLAAFPPLDRPDAALTTEAAKQIATAMAYDDVIRVADIKTRADRIGRIRAEVAATPAQLVTATEYMHPGVAEICGMMPAKLGAYVEASGFWSGQLARFARGRHVRTSTLRWFIPLYLLAGLKRYRRRTLRHAREAAHLRAWLARAMEAAATDADLALEILRARRLVKGYSDTRARGESRFDTLMEAAAALHARPDAAAWMRRLREAALRDATGKTLDETFSTVRSFLADPS